MNMMNDGKTIFRSGAVRLIGWTDGSVRVEIWSLAGRMGEDDHPIAAYSLDNTEADELVVALRERTMRR